jgi:hypothetical protein
MTLLCMLMFSLNVSVCHVIKFEDDFRILMVMKLLVCFSFNCR